VLWELRVGSPPGRTDHGSGAVHVLPDDGIDLIDELGRQPGDILITKYTRSAFRGTRLAGTLREASVTRSSSAASPPAWVWSPPRATPTRTDCT
jgi:hypothetical protein